MILQHKQLRQTSIVLHRKMLKIKTSGKKDERKKEMIRTVCAASILYFRWRCSFSGIGKKAAYENRDK